MTGIYFDPHDFNLGALYFSIMWFSMLPLPFLMLNLCSEWLITLL